MVKPRNGSIIWLWMLDYDGGVQHSWLSVFRMQTRDYKQLYLVCYESNLKWRRSAHRFPLRSYTSQILVRICLPLGVIFIVWNPVLKSHPHCAFLYQILTWNLCEGHVKRLNGYYGILCYLSLNWFNLGQVVTDRPNPSRKFIRNDFDSPTI